MSSTSIPGSSSRLLALALVLNSASMPFAQSSAKGPFDLQGHRGARGLAPENTLAAFATALSLGVTTLELDCAITRDGIPVVSHDTELNPSHTRDAQGRFLESAGPTLVSKTYAELGPYDVGRLKPGSAYAAQWPDQRQEDGQRIPRLLDVFALAKKAGNTEVRFNIETKIFPLQPELTAAAEPFTEAVVGALRAAGMEKRASIQSFDWRTLKIVQRIAPGVATVALTSQRPSNDTVQVGRPGPSPWLAGLDVDDFAGSVPRVVKASGSRVWSPNYMDIDARAVEEAHALGLSVIPWTINETVDMERFLGMGVDGIITDRPDRLRVALAARGMPLPRPTAVQP